MVSIQFIAKLKLVFKLISTVSSGRSRSQTTLDSSRQAEDILRVLSLWIPKNRERTGSHHERMRKISNMRGISPRMPPVARMRSETILSTTSWQDFDIDEKPSRKRAESVLSFSTTSGDQDFLRSSHTSDTLVEMITSKEVSRDGAVRIHTFTNLHSFQVGLFDNCDVISRPIFEMCLLKTISFSE